MATRGARVPHGLTLRDYRSDDPAMQHCFRLAQAAARTDLPVLILGESGTGKTALARALHFSSHRASFPFVAFNSAALSETLLDSQLFGHERGAFTGAEARVKGKFELADHGTLFLDEIADMSPSAQAKILRVVEHGEFERLGSEKLEVVDVRIVAATHLPIAELVGSQFRRDLFYRVRGITLNLPPLRERPSDLRALLATEVRRAAEAQGKRIEGLDREAAARLLHYAWPGNLRELKSVLQTAVAMTEGTVIRNESVLLYGDCGSPQPAAAAAPVSLPPSDDWTLRRAEQRHIAWVLSQVGGNKRRAAQLLGLSRSTLDRKLARLAPPVTT